MTTPTWANGARNPLLVIPSMVDILPDFGFRAGSFASNPTHWNAGGDVVPTLVIGEGEDLGSAVKFVPGAAQTAWLNLNAIRYPQFLSALATGGASYSATARLRIKAKSVGGGGRVFTLFIDWYTSAGGYISTAAPTSLSIATGGDIPGDNTFREYRMTIGTVPSNARGVGGIVGCWYASADPGDVYLDWISLGFELDLAEMGPSRRGAFIADRFPLSSVAEVRRQRAANGTIEQQAWNDGLRDVNFRTTPVDDTARTQIKLFTELATQGVPFTVLQNQRDLSRFTSILRARWMNDGDGLKQLQGTPYHEWEVAAEEVQQV